MKKVIIGCKSVFTYMKYKILYGSRYTNGKNQFTERQD